MCTNSPQAPPFAAGPTPGLQANGVLWYVAAGIDALRVLDPRVDELTALVERAELLAEAVDRLAGRERERGGPLVAAAQPADGGQPRRSVDAKIGAGFEQQAVVVQQPQAQRRFDDFERGVPGGERPRSGPRARHRARLRLADDDAVVGPVGGTGAQAEHAGAAGGDLEDVAGRRREGDARRRGAETPLGVERQIDGRIERHGG